MHQWLCRCLKALPGSTCHHRIYWLHFCHILSWLRQFGTEIWDTWASAHLRSILFSSPPSWFNFEQLPSSSSKGAGSTAVAWDPRLQSECVIQLKHCNYCNPATAFAFDLFGRVSTVSSCYLTFLSKSFQHTFGRSCDCTIQSYWLTDIYGQLSTPGGLRFLDDSTSMRCSGRGWQDGKMAREDEDSLWICSLQFLASITLVVRLCALFELYPWMTDSAIFGGHCRIQIGMAPSQSTWTYVFRQTLKPLSVDCRIVDWKFVWSKGE